MWCDTFLKSRFVVDSGRGGKSIGVGLRMHSNLNCHIIEWLQVLARTPRIHDNPTRWDTFRDSLLVNRPAHVYRERSRDWHRLVPRAH